MRASARISCGEAMLFESEKVAKANYSHITSHPRSAGVTIASALGRMQHGKSAMNATTDIPAVFFLTIPDKLFGI